MKKAFLPLILTLLIATTGCQKHSDDNSSIEPYSEESETLSEVSEESESESESESKSESEVDPEEAKYLTVSQAIALAMEAGPQGTQDAEFVKGTVKTISNSLYGEMYITDGTNDLYIYGIEGYADMEERPYAGDDVYLLGVLKTYNDSPEMGRAQLQKFVSHQGEIDINDYSPKTALEARNAEVGDKVLLEGVVAKITFANGRKPNGFFLVDSTSSIYIYGLDVAARVKEGNKVKVAGTKNYYILESEKEEAANYGYQGCCQIDNAIYVDGDKEVHEFDKSWIEESTVKAMLDVKASEKNITTLIYKVKAVIHKVPGSGFVNYYIDDLDDKTGSYCYSMCNGGDFDWLDEFDGKVCTVYLSAFNMKSTKSGLVYRLIPVQVIDEPFTFDENKIPAFAIEYYAKGQFLDVYNADPNKAMQTTFSNEIIPFDGVLMNYASDNTALLDFVNDGTNVIMHTYKGEGDVTITMTAAYEGKTASDTIKVHVAVSDELPEYVSVASAIAAQDNTIVTVRGIVMSSLTNQKGFYINDGTGVIAVRTDSDTLAKIEMGNDVIMKGTRTHVTKDPNQYVGQSCIDNATLELNLLGEHEYDTSTFIKDKTFEDIYDMIQDSPTKDYTTNVYVFKCKLTKYETQYSTNIEIMSDKADLSASSNPYIYLYAGSGSQWSMFNPFQGKEITVEFMFVNWNSKTPYRGCLISATDGETKIMNNLNFR